jgi:hypothetical protein
MSKNIFHKLSPYELFNCVIGYIPDTIYSDSPRGGTCRTINGDKRPLTAQPRGVNGEEQNRGSAPAHLSELIEAAHKSGSAEQPGKFTLTGRHRAQEVRVVFHIRGQDIPVPLVRCSGIGELFRVCIPSVRFCGIGQFFRSQQWGT